ITKAQQLLKLERFPLEDTYFLWLNADMVVEFDKTFKKQTLDKNSYLILETSYSLRCASYVKHLLRASVPWACNDPIYPLWVGEESPESGKLEQIVIKGGYT